MPEAYLERFQVGSDSNSVQGPDLASAATIAPTHMIHRVTGTAAIVNITPPWPNFSGIIILVATAAWTWTAAGNIAVVSVGAMAAGEAAVLAFVPSTQKWYVVSDPTGI